MGINNMLPGLFQKLGVKQLQDELRARNVHHTSTTKKGPAERVGYSIKGRTAGTYPPTTNSKPSTVTC